MIRPIKVTALPEYKIRVLYEDNTEGVVDLSTFVEGGIFIRLKDKTAFKKVYVTKSSIAWSDELEIDTAAVYSEIKRKSPKELFHPFISHAAD